MTTTSTAAATAPTTPAPKLGPKPVISADAYCISCGAPSGYGCC